MSILDHKSVKTHYAKLPDDTYNILTIDPDSILDKLAPAIYRLEYSVQRGFYLVAETERFAVPEKLYGNSQTHINKVLKAYEHRSRSTNVLATGIKGAGKTMEMQCIANAAMDKYDIPTIIINQGFSGSEFVDIVEKLGEIVLFCDEFGKLFKGDNGSRDTTPQHSFLTLLDGISRYKRMTLITENELLDVDEYLLNRPGRIYYHFKYKHLSKDAILDYCASRGIDGSMVDAIVKASHKIRYFSFDMLQAIVEELDITGAIAPKELPNLLSDLNIDYMSSTGDYYVVVEARRLDPNQNVWVPVTLNKSCMSMQLFEQESYSYYNDELYISYDANATSSTESARPNSFAKLLKEKTDDDGEKDSKPDFKSVRFEIEHLIGEDSDKNVYIFRNGDIEATFMKIENAGFGRPANQYKVLNA